MTRLFRFAAYAAAAAALLVACSKGGTGGGGGIFGLNAPTSSFPVYSPSTVIASGKYDDSSEITAIGSNLFGQGQDAYKPYLGVQELIKTSATADQLNTWLKGIVKAPPGDLVATYSTTERWTNAEPGASPAAEGSPAAAETSSPASSETASPAASETATPATSDTSSPGMPIPMGTGQDPAMVMFSAFGLEPAGFISKDDSHAVLIMIVDPKAVAEHLGPTMDLIDQYEKLPALLRGGIDDTVKKQLGFSVSDLMNTNTPTGMIVYAARNWKNEDSRAIILIDAQRQANVLPTPHNT